MVAFVCCDAWLIVAVEWVLVAACVLPNAGRARYLVGRRALSVAVRLGQYTFPSTPTGTW